MRLADMSVDELRARAERIRELNPHTYESSQAYKNTVARLRRLQDEAGKAGRALSCDGHPVTILRTYIEGEHEFAVVRYEDGHLPHAVGGRLAGTEDAPLWEHRVHDGMVVKSGGDYWNDDDWTLEHGLQPLGTPQDECPGHPAGPCDPMGETVYCDGTCQA